MSPKFLFFLLSLLFAGLFSPISKAMSFDCRWQQDPTEGYVIFLKDRHAELHSYFHESENGPVWSGDVRTENSDYYYVIRAQMVLHEKPGVYEVWIPQPHMEHPVFAAEVFYYGDVGDRIAYRRFIDLLSCHVKSESAPSLFGPGI
jgi:hypothetical protein